MGRSRPDRRRRARAQIASALGRLARSNRCHAAQRRHRLDAWTSTPRPPAATRAAVDGLVILLRAGHSRFPECFPGLTHEWATRRKLETFRAYGRKGC